MQYPNNLVRLRCRSFAINLTSFSNSVNPWRKVTSCFFTAISTPFSNEPEINQPTNSQGALLQGTSVIACDSSDLAANTNNFSLANKIENGDFDNVCKFESEVKLITKIQHRNLTKLLGYCINGAGKFLVCEFMANNSLDKTEIREYPSEIEKLLRACRITARRGTTNTYSSWKQM
ncbi:hypothetical protein H5410_052368, partial [Solanum commersonii]